MRAAATVSAVLALGLATPALSQNVVADREQIAQVLRAAGYRAEVMGEAGEDRYIVTGTGGTNFTIHMYGCDEAGAACKTVMFYAWFEADPTPSLEAMNSYTAMRRWGRFYIDSEGDPVIEMDIDLEDGGMSPELFIDNVEYWDLALNDFAHFVASGQLPAE